MIGATRRWIRRNRRGLAIGAGVLGAGYLASQYVVNKITEARERMSSDRIAREKLVAAPPSSCFRFSEFPVPHLRPCHSACDTEPKTDHVT